MLRHVSLNIDIDCYQRLAATMRNAFLLLAFACAGSLLAHNARAITYSNFIENGGWSSESSLFACRLIHTIPYLGKAEFEKPAGEPMEFRLKTNTPTLKTGQAQLVAAAPVWKSSTGRRDLGFVPVQERRHQVTLQGFKPERMLAELFEGQELLISRKPRYGGDETSRVAITPIGFRAAYREYTACLALLLPVNFEQIQRTSIYFGSDQSNLTPSEQNKLDNIIAYLKADPIVQEFFIDGHTDAVGSQPDNMALAKKRAEMVSHYLIKQGMPKDAFWVRWHGERYPVAANNDRLGRAKNRRVTIRLETEKTQGDDKGDASPGGDIRPVEAGTPAPIPPAPSAEAVQATPPAAIQEPTGTPQALTSPVTPATTPPVAPIAPTQNTSSTQTTPNTSNAEPSTAPLTTASPTPKI